MVARLIDRLWPRRPRLRIEIRQVCFDTILESLEADWSDYRVDLYLFLYLWAVNTEEVPTTVKEWRLMVLANSQTIRAEPAEDFSDCHQHIKVHAKQQGFDVVKDIRKPLNPFPKQPLQQGIPLEGWVCFIVRATKQSLMHNASLTLMGIDSFDGQHSVKSRAPWPCRGDIISPKLLE